MDIKDTQPVEFTGVTKDYFGIWIANLFLTILTIGIYSAWAKVRQTQYLYGHTRILGSPLSYHATGKQILIGRLVAIGILLLVSLAQQISPYIYFLALLVLLLFLPVLINRALSFRARMTSWETIHFHWHSTYGGTFMAFIVWPFIGILTFGLLLPVATKKRNEYIMNHLRLGTTQFSAATELSSYYTALFVAGFNFIAWGFVGVVINLSFFLPASTREEFMAAFAPIIGGYLILFLAATIYATMVRNILFNGLRLGKFALFRSRLSSVRVFWIYVSNLIAIIGTLFLATPWAQIRLRRYMCVHTDIMPLTDDRDFRDMLETEGSAIGDEYALLGDIDIGI